MKWFQLGQSGEIIEKTVMVKRAKMGQTGQNVVKIGCNNYIKAKSCLNELISVKISQ